MFRRRRALTADLLKDGIGTIILESPFYGGRKPQRQERSKLRHVADLIKLGAMTMLEALWLIHMLHKAGVSKVCWRVLVLQTCIAKPDCCHQRGGGGGGGS